MSYRSKNSLVVEDVGRVVVVGETTWIKNNSSEIIFSSLTCCYAG